MADTLKSGKGILEKREAGILLHVSSLPGPAYIGDIGPAAISFAEFLHESAQSVWQMLPVQPVGADQGFSPYSSSSAMAGNSLLISPHLLARDGLIQAGDIKRGSSTDTRVNFQKAAMYKDNLLEKAWVNWQKAAGKADKTAFIEFCEREHDWLNDYALYTVIKALHKNDPWYKWPAEFRRYNEASLKKLESQYREDLDRVKWIQMIFDKQWKALHQFCDSLDIRLLGDVPIYVAHDSADVWSHRDIFTVDDDGKLTEVAGVPPDLFNSDGQLWGMPLYHWDVLKESDYKWWLSRLRKNLAWFDVIRLDHFRGFSSYWSVPAGSKSAKNGNWITGPANSLFDSLKSEMGNLPFVAEDLGEIDKPVYMLRDEYALPGMNVLQFAFGDDMPKSSYLPHNYITNSVVYTGTHDNNTTVGWYKDASKTERQNLAAYAGVKVHPNNVAETMIRLAYSSISKLAILPMQDILALDGSARMNMPASSSGNWTWRMRKDQQAKAVAEKLQRWTAIYDRAGR